MADNSSYDVIIIGGGQAAFPLAYDLAEAGRQVAIVERKRLGGATVNFGPLPTKAALASAKLTYRARHAERFGLAIPEVRVDLRAVLAQARALAIEERVRWEARLRGSQNPKLICGHARFTGKRGRRFALQVDGLGLEASEVVVNTGSRSRLPEMAGIESVPYLHAGNWLENELLPEHLVMVGGGYVGLELGQFYRRLGASVTVIHQGDHLLPKEDADVAQALKGYLEEEGVRFILKAEATSVVKEGEVIRVRYRKGGREEDVTGSHLFLATGRLPNTDTLGLETVDINPDSSGYIEVDETLATKVPGIWAAGDARTGPSYAHSAYDDYRVLAAQLLRRAFRSAWQVVPYAIFTDPELGRVGMTEYDARRTGQEIKVVRYDVAKNWRARGSREGQGLIKLVVNAATKQLLGAAVLAPGGGEIVHLCVDLINAGLPYTLIKDGVYIHPTLSEALQSAVALLDA